MNTFKNKNILIVEDDDFLRELIVGVFKDEGANVSEAPNGAIALEMIKKNSYNAVVTDIRMPGGDGITLARKMKELPTKKTYLFVCSGFNDLTPDLAKDLNITRVFEKPFDDRELIKEVLKYMID